MFSGPVLDGVGRERPARGERLSTTLSQIARLADMSGDSCDGDERSSIDLESTRFLPCVLIYR